MNAALRGRFITLEGGEGAGKSTQVKRLAERLRALGQEVVVTREPGGTPEAEAIRQLLVTGEPGRWDAWTETLLHYAARRAHTERLLRPALARGAWVISDRYADSTMAYQGYAGGVGREAVLALHKLALDGFAPDLTLILDLPVEQGLARAKIRHTGSAAAEDRYERMGLDFHRKLRAAFIDIAAREPDRCRVVPALGDVEEVAAALWAAMAARFNLPA